MKHLVLLQLTNSFDIFCTIGYIVRFSKINNTFFSTRVFVEYFDEVLS